MPEFEKMGNAYAGQRAIILGKGPSLQQWIAAGQPGRGAGAFVVVVNQAAALAEAEIGITTDGPAPLAAHRGWSLVGLPWRLPGGPWRFDTGGCDWFLHADDQLGERQSLRLSREQVAWQRQLYCCLGSVNPAVHLAWYLGAAQVLVVGVDGGGGYAPEANFPTAPSTDEAYARIRRSVVRELDTLFSDRWQTWKEPNAGAVPRRGSDVGTSPLLAVSESGDK